MFFRAKEPVRIAEPTAAGKLRLLSPFRLAGLPLRNRIVMPPMMTNYGTDDGFVSERSTWYYQTRAAGGVGLIIVEATSVDPGGRLYKGQLRIDDDRFIPSLSHLATTVKERGARIALQLHHAGSATNEGLIGVQTVAPSAVMGSRGAMPRPLGWEEIGDLVQCFARAAERAKRAGFDGVEIHAAHAQLVHQFLSSFFNRRSDGYGGNLEGRSRFLVEIIRAAKKLTGGDFPVWFRTHSKEFDPESGMTSQEALEVARIAQAAGVDAIHVSVYGDGLGHRSPMAQPHGSWICFAEAIKRAVGIPVIAVGRFDVPSGEAAVREEKADLIAIGRGLIADPELPNKAAAGKIDEIRPCLGCYNCSANLSRRLGCTVNPTLGQEQECRIAVAKRPKKVFVIGGGPAGMEAARVAAARGHNVTLFERAPRPGGQLILGAVPPDKQVLAEFADFQQRELKRLGVKVELGREATAALIGDAKPDAVIVAAGSHPVAPEIPGVDRPNVVSALDVLAGTVDVGQSVAIIGAELVGCETAEYLAEKGRCVTVMKRGPDAATKVNSKQRYPLLSRLAYKGVAILTGVRYEEITAAGVRIVDKEGQPQLIAAETIVLAAGSSPNNDVAQSLSGLVPELYNAGDCVEPRDLQSAIAEGFEAGLRV